MQQLVLPVCGLVMPISASDGMSEAHWADVLAIFNDAIRQAGFEPNLVSNADDVGIIQKRIIQNLYDNPIAVVDVSGKNPNVMFELGIRLAFDKPTIIVKDDKTSYSFDTAPIEHVPYPRDLRFAKIVGFKEKLASKIKGTYKAATENVNYTTFLKAFWGIHSSEARQERTSCTGIHVRGDEGNSRLDTAVRATKYIKRHSASKCWFPEHRA
jgi:hypothetical protein